MISTSFKIIQQHGYQAIRNLAQVELPDIFRGRPTLIINNLDREVFAKTCALCPTGALGDFYLDMGRCLFCGECEMRHPQNIKFSNNYRIAARNREDLLVKEGSPTPALIPENRLKIFNKALKLRQVSAGGDGSCEMELNASGNVNFDFARFGVEFVASPRQADGIVITGPITTNMAREVQVVYDAIPTPKIVIAVGTDAISGGLFADSPAIDRSFFDRHKPDLWIPGNPTHPMTFIHGISTLLNFR